MEFMELVQSLADIEANIKRLESYLAATANPEDRRFARRLIGAGRCFIAVRRDGHLFFGPSRFLGYRNNSRHSHLDNTEKDGKDTNPAISNALDRQLREDVDLEEAYRQFCSSIGANCSNNHRKYWLMGEQTPTISTPSDPPSVDGPSSTSNRWQQILFGFGKDVKQIIVAVIIAVLSAIVLAWLKLSK